MVQDVVVLHQSRIVEKIDHQEEQDFFPGYARRDFIYIIGKV